MDFIYNTLINANNQLSNKQYVHIIREIQEELKHGICPRCCGKLVKKQGKYGKFWGCFNYPKCTFVLKK